MKTKDAYRHAEEIARAARLSELWKLAGHFSGTNPELDEYLKRRIARLEAQRDG